MKKPFFVFIYSLFNTLLLTNCNNHHKGCETIIGLNGGSEITWKLNKTWFDPGYSAFNDCQDEELTSLVTIQGSVDENIVGVYSLTYSVISEYGRATAKRNVKVLNEANKFAGNYYATKTSCAQAQCSWTATLTASSNVNNRVIDKNFGNYSGVDIYFDITDNNINIPLQTKVVNSIYIDIKGSGFINVSNITLIYSETIGTTVNGPFTIQLSK